MFNLQISQELWKFLGIIANPPRGKTTCEFYMQTFVKNQTFLESIQKSMNSKMTEITCSFVS